MESKGKLLWKTNVKFGEILDRPPLPNNARAGTTPNENFLIENHFKECDRDQFSWSKRRIKQTLRGPTAFLNDAHRSG